MKLIIYGATTKLKVACLTAKTVWRALKYDCMIYYYIKKHEQLESNYLVIEVTVDPRKINKTIKEVCYFF